MRILTVVGARPQFIKAAALSRVLRREHQEFLVHTGQHHDPRMSAVFFDELRIPAPDVNLGIAGGTHAEMTARMLVALEEVMTQQKPDALLVYGDTNSTLAAALAAVKLHIPVLHVEAGNRLGSLYNPEEANRIVTDHLAALLFACVPSAMEALKAEGLGERSILVGDPMYDAFRFYARLQEDAPPPMLAGIGGDAVTPAGAYYYLTCHREENTRDDAALSNVLRAMNALDAPTYYPVHPRNRAAARRLCEGLGLANVRLLEPVGYLESLWLVRHAKRVVTDSGGVQREAYFARVPCVTVFPYVLWPETMTGACNQLASPDEDDIRAKLSVAPVWEDTHPFGDGHACEKICHALQEFSYIGEQRIK